MDNIQPMRVLVACEGILRRAERRGKQLPEMLRIALEQTIARESA